MKTLKVIGAVLISAYLLMVSYGTGVGYIQGETFEEWVTMQIVEGGA